MRTVVLASLLLATLAPSASAQSTLHEYRPEIILTIPTAVWVDVKLLLDERLAMSDLAPNEIVLGVSLQSPQFHRTSLALEMRQVKMRRGNVEHRYVPTVYSNFELPAGFDMRNRTRFEMRVEEGEWSRRYINRSAIGHDVAVGSRAVFPYIQSDLFYDCRAGYLNRQDWAIGVRVPLTQASSIDPFVARSSDKLRTPRLGVTAGALLRVTL